MLITGKGPALAAALCIAAAPAMAQSCGPRADLVESLATKYGETPRTRGIDQAGYLMEIFANDERGTWSLVRTSPGLRSCLIVVGAGYEQVPLQAKGDPT